MRKMEKNAGNVLKATAAPKPPLAPILWNLLIVFSVGIYSSYTILVHLCEVNGKIPFSSGALNFCIELTKFCLSFGMFCCTERHDAASSVSNERICSIFPKLKLRTILSFSIPAVLYCINNNLAIYIQLQMDPATYQVLGNMKILTTAILFRLIIKKKIPKKQVIALGILLISGIMNSIGGLMANNRGNKASASASTLHITMLGLFMITNYCFISGLAGVYTEYVLKKQMEINLHLQNALLYSFGLLLNTCTFVAQNWSKGSDLHPFHGFTIYTWTIVATQAVCGIMMGAVMKYATNITRLFIISSAVVVTTVTSMFIFGLRLNISFVISFVLIVAALVLYHQPSPPPETKDSGETASA